MHFSASAPTTDFPGLFHWDNGLKLTRPDLAIDFRRRQPRAFISHAHADHIARHELALCTPETSALYQHRLGPRPTKLLPYHEPLEWRGVRLTTFPAGHCLGSAMLLVEQDAQSLLYTGDFKLGPSATSREAEFPHADVLVIESTYGHCDYRLPPRESAIEQLLTIVHQAITDEVVPVIEAYSLGKAQEVTRILTDRDIPVLQHRNAFAISRIYESFGVHLGRCECFTGETPQGWVIVVPPGVAMQETAPRQTRIAVTGWAVDARTKYRMRVDHAVPLSDHADYDGLFEAIERVAPKVIYCTHGPESFVDRLREANYNARPLGRSLQSRLF